MRISDWSSDVCSSDLNNWQIFADVVFQSFSSLGLEATRTGLTPDQLLRPGFVAGTGFEAAYPLIKQAGDLLGFTTFFDNAVTILVLVFAWLVVVLAFFILSIQLLDRKSTRLNSSH